MVPLVRDLLCELRRGLVSLYGNRLSDLVLFGSQARGDAEAGSDIDVLVVLSGPVQPGTEIGRVSPMTTALSLEHSVVISCTFVSAERYAGERSPLLMNIRREGVPV